MKVTAVKCPPLKRPRPATLKKIQALAKTQKGRVAAVEPKTGEFFIADTAVEAVEKGRTKFPEAVFYLVRVGYPAMDFQSGGLQKVRPPSPGLSIATRLTSWRIS